MLPVGGRLSGRAEQFLVDRARPRLGRGDRVATDEVDEALVAYRKASIRFGAQQVLRDIDFGVFRGQTVAVIGESGCGKTVLLKLTIGLLRPTAGQVIQNTSASRSGTLLNSSGGSLGTVTADKVVYATMTNTDVTLYELTDTYAALKTRTGVTARCRWP